MSVTQLKVELPTQQSSNFGFLQNQLNELYIQATQAEKYASLDSQSSLAKMRLFVELACHELGKHFDLRPPVSGELAEKIKQLEASGHIEPWVIESMDRLRRYGNQSVHICQSFGHFVAQFKMSADRVEDLLRDLHDIAKYLADKLLNMPTHTLPEWAPNASLELTETISLALSGDANASYSIAKHFVQKLSEQEFADKDQRASWQMDVNYWSDKAIKQGCTQTYLLKAQSYADKVLTGASKDEIKALFKQATLHDQEGEALVKFGEYLVKVGEKRLALERFTQAAEKANHKAISYLQSVSYKTDKEIYLELVATGIEAGHPCSYTLDAFEKIKRVEQNPEDELALKSLRSALIMADAKKAPHIAFFQAYASFISEKALNKTLTAEQRAQMMVDEFDDMPAELDIHYRMFNVLAESEQHLDTMNKLFDRAIQQTDDVSEHARIKSVLAIRAVEMLKQKELVKTPMPITKMLEEAANDGDANARSFINSAEGKAIMKRSAYGVSGRIGRKAGAEKAKDKKKRKAAKKARRR
ncbi:DUF4145 domain-containing protein [Vibrio ishigakensis]|uniref:DUF4145 domain-containing protein n=1 Tax=Vibrio ishigakensis TaxID=1481914 RepID=UPI0021C369B5|nr:DUF4145 domain-containing protein [Vibrio ishigakensis]